MNSLNPYALTTWSALDVSLVIIRAFLHTLFLEGFASLSYMAKCSNVLTSFFLPGYVFNQQTVPASFNFGGTPLGR
jgi:hypothetical protein